MNNNIYNTIVSKSLTYEQKIIALAREAENSISVLDYSAELQNFVEKNIICDLSEGNAPFRPRYILPDYSKFLKNGSEFLDLPPANDLLEAVNHLLIIYRHTPSITGFPVYLGNLDTLLEPFFVNESESRKILRIFLIQLDRTLTDSFVHANIGPKPTKIGKIILELERELQNAVPNLTLKYSDETTEEFAIEAIKTGLLAAKPYFVNHKMMVEDFGEDYGIASCYNSLPLGGGSYTLMRLNMKKLAEQANNIDEFLNEVLPLGVELMCEMMDKRIDFIVEKSNFFESHFLAKENLISYVKFTAMFGIFGLAECVDYFVKPQNLKQSYGHSEYANDLSVKIVEKLNELVYNHDNKHCKISNLKFLLHAQCGIGTDYETSPGCRIPAGKEPELSEHIIHSCSLHKYFKSGISDIFTFEKTALDNPGFVLDIIKGALNSNLRIFAFYKRDNDLIRITGYLVKKSEIEKYKNNQQNLHDTVMLGAPSADSLNIFDRKIYGGN